MLCGIVLKKPPLNIIGLFFRPIHVHSFYHKKRRILTQQLLSRSVFPLQPSAFFNEHKRVMVNIDEAPIKKYISEFLTNDDRSSENAAKKLKVEDLMKQREQVIANISSLNDLKQDKEMKELAEEELLSSQTELSGLDNEIIKLLVPRNAHENYSDIAVEISSGAGGQEAMLFANELLELYQNYANFRSWNFLLESVDSSDLGGIRSASFFISGSGAFNYFQNEIGVHRVQRVPVTSPKGIIHTSTAAVLVMPQPTEVDIQISEKDLIIETMKASGPGGQHVNKTETAVRVKHVPSGMVTECQEGKSQYRNKEIAIMKIRTKLYDMEIQKQSSELSATRQLQIGNRERSAKIRTYNIPQNRITDHRGQVTAHNVKEFMMGREAFHNFLEKLNEHIDIQTISLFVDNVRHAFRER